MKYIQSVNPFWSASKQPDNLNPLSMLRKLWSNSVEWTIGVFSDYIADILSPAWDGTKSILNTINPNAYRDNGVIKNIPKSLFGGVTRYGTALKNILAWGVWAVGKAYQNLGQDNLSDLSSGTVDNISVIWPLTWNIAKTIASIPALAWKIPSFLTKNVVDKPFDWANTKTARTNREIPKTILRI